MDFQINERRLPAPINITVSIPKGPGHLLIVWDSVKNPDLNKYPDGEPKIIKVKYNVYRGLSIGGIFYKMNKQPLEQLRFEDEKVGRNPNTQYFYKVSTVAEFDDGYEKYDVEGELSSPVIFHIPTTNKWFKKINERNMWILKNTGVLMDLYIRKTDGERCDKCLSQTRGQGYADCLECFGTTYKGGYEPMTQLYVRQKPATQQLELTPHGYVQNSTPGAWTISNVKLTNRDLLINPEGKIFSITGSHVSHAAGYLFHQELTMRELDPTDRLYKIKRTTLYPEW
ncbi:gp175 [Bacillus phage G]|uniref:Gp175 n=1 Tax=Bacillus phage G TaxID=2884420 RepID=G3MBP1_9CAUD|nr:gp175 [Bacillus phage G]AEO93435.1 gp175 [Bacillus phage G]